MALGPLCGRHPLLPLFLLPHINWFQYQLLDLHLRAARKSHRPTTPNFLRSLLPNAIRIWLHCMYNHHPSLPLPTLQSKNWNKWILTKCSSPLYHDTTLARSLCHLRTAEKLRQPRSSRTASLSSHFTPVCMITSSAPPAHRLFLSILRG